MHFLWFNFTHEPLNKLGTFLLEQQRQSSLQDGFYINEKWGTLTLNIKLSTLSYLSNWTITFFASFLHTSNTNHLVQRLLNIFQTTARSTLDNWKNHIILIHFLNKAHVVNASMTSFMKYAGISVNASAIECTFWELYAINKLHKGSTSMEAEMHFIWLVIGYRFPCYMGQLYYIYTGLF